MHTMRCASGLAALLFLSAATAQSAAESFSDRPMSLVIGADVGGGFDAYGRAVARQLGRYLPGNPSVIPRNQPGAGSGVAAAHIYNVAPKDGTTIGSLFPGVIVSLLLDERPSTNFDPKTFNYLGSVYGGPRICVSYGASKIKTFKDVQTQKSIFGATAVGGGTRDYANLLKRVAGAQYDIVTGYKGPNDLYLAMERGEIDGVCGQDWSPFKLLRPNWLQEKTANILIQIGSQPDPELTAMGVPHVWTVVPDAQDRAAAELVFSQQAFGGPYVVPPGVPAERVQLLRQAFAKVMTDSDFLAEIAQKRLEVRPLPGDVTQALIEKLYSSPAALVGRAKAIIAGR